MTALGRRAILVGALGAACATPKKPPTSAVAGSADGAETLETDHGPILFDRFDPQDGPRDAPIVIVVFSDFECPFCGDAAATIAAERRARPGKTRLVFKHYPLTMHPRARALAALAQAVFLVKGNAAFWTLHDRLFAKPNASDVEIGVWVGELGVTPEAIDAVSQRSAERIGADLTLARLRGLNGAPAIFVNRKAIDGAPVPELLRVFLDDAS